MRADAPGKLVLSGAYAVLRGAPAIVTAVDRRVTADTSRPADFRAPEVEAGLRILGSRSALPHYDASPLRSSEDKLGLGSSAAICVASLGALLVEEHPEMYEQALRAKLYPLAREAHRLAQAGGSGIDVAAACFGGTIVAQLDPTDPDAPPQLEPLVLPKGLTIEVWGSKHSASTKEFVRRVFALESTKPVPFATALAHQSDASEAAVTALRSGDRPAFVAALRDQGRALGQLGALAGLPIVPRNIVRLSLHLEDDSALLPSGAGGGDVSLYIGPRPSSEKFRERAIEAGLFLVPLEVGAEGFRRLGTSNHG